MKKQIIAAISTHPVRAAFLLILLFLLGSVMHQAVGEGNTGKRSVAANLSQVARPLTGAISAAAGSNISGAVQGKLATDSNVPTSSVTTLFTSNNFGNSGGAVYFDLTVASSPISVTALDINTGETVSFSNFRVYVLPGMTSVGHETNMALWTQVATGSGTGAGVDLPTHVTLSNPFPLNAGTLYGIALVADPAITHHYTNGNGSNQNYSNANVSLVLGSTSNVPFTAPVFSPRVWNGTVYYDVGGGAGACDYIFTAGTGTIVPGTTDTGNHIDDGTTAITLPFSYQLYGQSFTAANISSNGNLQLVSNSTLLTNACPLPSATFNMAIMPHWDDLRTDQVGTGCTAYGGVGCGVFTSISGTAPNRIFNIEWRTVYFGANTTRANFEVRLYENPALNRFDFVYGEMAQTGSSATVGVQKGTGAQFTQYECNTAGTLTAGLKLTASCGGCQFRVLIVYTDTAAPTQLQSEILAEPGVIAVDLFDAQAGTPTLGQLQQYQIVVPYSNFPFLDAATLGNNLADYVDGGGVAVQLGFSHYGPSQPYGVNGRWVTGNYNPYSYSTNIQFSAFSLGSFNAGHPLMAGVTMLNGDFANVVTPAAGATQVAANNLGNSLVAYRPVSGGHTTVGVTAYVGSDATQSGDWGKVIVNAGRWLGGSCAPVPSSAVSRKVHGAFTGDINLPLVAIGGAVGIECRNGAGGYQMVVTFPSPVTVSGVAVTSGTGSATFSGSGTAVITVNLTGVTDAQRLGVTLANVNDGTSTGNVLVPMGVLIGDSAGTGNGSVNAGDVGFVKSQSGVAVGAGNFRADVAINGTINASDIGQVKSNSGHSLPP